MYSIIFLSVNNAITSLIKTGLISSASLSSSESIVFNTCLFNSNSLKTNTFCFQFLNKLMNLDDLLKLELVIERDIPIKSLLYQNL
ncbi:hypothetical protein [Aquimarina discodermiae]|uniref:hypothetical protein n=1 Tax=Aquimarina discodermiae TaxID=3231043 RepID=UPI00403AE3F8